MGYNSGRTGDATKALLDRTQYKALHKEVGGQTTQETLGGGNIIFGTNNGTIVTDMITDSSLLGKKCLVNVDGSGNPRLVDSTSTFGEYVTLNTNQINPGIMGAKKFHQGIVVSNTDGTHAGPGVSIKGDGYNLNICYEGGVDSYGPFSVNFGMTQRGKFGLNNFHNDSGDGKGKLFIYKEAGLQTGYEPACYLYFPMVGTSASPKTLATTDDISSYHDVTKANDNAVVHKTGDETITGVKTFTNGISFVSSMGPGSVGIMSDGDLGVKISGEYIDLRNTMGVVARTLVYNNQDTHGLAVPNTASWSASKTIATTDDLTGFVTGPSSATTDNTIALFDGTTGKIIKSASNISIDNATAVLSPTLSSLGSLGSSSKKWGSVHTQILTVYTRINSNSSNKGLVLPDTTSYTANKTLATTDDIPTDYVHKGTSSSPSNEEIYGLKTLHDGIKLGDSSYGFTNDFVTLKDNGYNNLKIVGSSSENISGIEVMDGSGLNESVAHSYFKIHNTPGGVSQLIFNNGTGNVTYKGTLNLPITDTSVKTIATTEDCGTKLYKHTLTVFTSGPKIVIINDKPNPYTEIYSIAMNRDSSAMTNCFDCYGEGLGHIECITVTGGTPGSTINLYGYGFSNDVPTLQCIFTGTRPDSSTTAITDVVTPL